MARAAALLTVILVLLAIPVQSLAGDPAPHGAVDTARQYTRLFNEGRVTEAFERLWDFDCFQQIVFHKDLECCSEEERKIMFGRFGYLLPKIAIDPKEAKSPKDVTYTRFEEKPMSENLVAVRYLARFSDGTGSQITLILQNQKDTWRIVNQGVNKDKLTAARLREDYVKSKTKPAEFVNALIKQYEGK